MGPIASIDVGTNTTLLLVARAIDGKQPRDAEVLEEAAEITRLGRGIGKEGRLEPAGIDGTLAALSRYAAIAARHGATISAIGTEALRRAPNAKEFLDAAAAILGSPVDVISGDREAALTFRAAAESFPGDVSAGHVAVLDIGGGSTEIIRADHGVVKYHTSVPVGSVRLHERHVRHDPVLPEEMSAIERDVLNALHAAGAVPFAAPVDMLIGVAGTVTSLAAMVMRLPTYDPARVHGSTLALADLDGQIERLSALPQRERERIAGLDPRRADVILAGALLLRTIMRAAGAASLLVSDRGIRWGLFYERASGQSFDNR